MLAILYLLLASYICYYFLMKLLGARLDFSKMKSLTGKPVPLSKWMVFLPASFLIGTLLISWFTYMVTWLIAVFMPGIASPLLFGDIISFVLLILLTVFIFHKKFRDYAATAGELKKTGFGSVIGLFANNWLELTYVAVITVGSTIFMCRSLYFNKDTLCIGPSVFSDFGATLSILRSFSLGSNFPTIYPHFAENLKGMNDVLYHFMFQFLSGNMEFLGLRIDWAFNIPSILSIVAFLMLLYSLAVIITGRKLVGLLTAFLFTFRSSYAFFTFLSDTKETSALSLKSILSGLTKLAHNGQHIGKTVCEDWGFWTQKVYVNKRHFPFALGIAMFVFILMIPLFKNMIFRLKSFKKKYNDETRALEASQAASGETDAGAEALPVPQKRIYFLEWLKFTIKELFFTADAWLHASIVRPVAAGLILGLIGFWNGATVIASLPVLFLLAVFSKRRLEFLYTAVIAVLLAFLQTKFFMHTGGAVSFSYYFGFISPDRSFMGVVKFFGELLGILPIVLVLMLFTDFSGFIRRFWLLICFISPLVIATTFKFSVDIGANHVIIIFAVILLNILVADFLYEIVVKRSLIFDAIILIAVALYYYFCSTAFTHTFDTVNSFVLVVSVFLFIIVILFMLAYDLFATSSFKFRKAVSIGISVLLLACLSITGIADMYTLYKMDYTPATAYNVSDADFKWIESNTSPHDIFLINPVYTHKVLMAGRSVFLGGAYFTSGAGYDFNGRNQIVAQIYGGTDAATVKALLDENSIRYIVIDNSVKMSTDYKFNQALFDANFEKVYTSSISDIVIYKVPDK